MKYTKRSVVLLPDHYCIAYQAVIGQFPTEKDGLHLRRALFFRRLSGGTGFFQARELSCNLSV